MRFVRPVTRHAVALGALVAACLVLGGGQALAATTWVPLAGSASGTLTQVSAGEWTTTVALDTAALCAGQDPAGNTFSLVTGKPNTVTGAAAPEYPDGPLACGAVGANPVTEVKLTFAPALSAVPQNATLIVTPPPSLLVAEDTPMQVPLTVRRIVSPWQLVGIPAICGAALAALLVLVLVVIGMPAEPAAKPAAAPGPAAPDDARAGPPGQYVRVPERGRVGFGLLFLLLLMMKRHDLLVTPRRHPTGGVEAGAVEAGGVEAGAGARPAVAAPGAGQRRKRVRGGIEFWRTPLFAGAAWSFGDSWATSVTPLTALAGGILTASGAVTGLVPGVDLTRFGLLMVLAGALTTLAPLVFGALNSLFPERKADEPAPPGEVIAARLWVMLIASCLTVFAIGAEIGFVGLVLGFNLIVVSPSIRWIGPVAAGLAALLFLAYGAHSILTLSGQPSGTPKSTAKKSSFMI